ncbi:acyltransferase domain-containing protein [Arhodomonas sp. AD133]|uniref:acyltransferase domain-containing protein n=1 Tax=Arhodomonas sp. AD133 TaxID=3415009 RepID=UPI003EBBC5F0
MTPRTWMFSGQGSQYLGMGRKRYATDPPFRKWLDVCDAIVGDYTGYSVKRLMEDRSKGSENRLLELQRTNPALFAIQYALGRSLLDGSEESPDYLLGYSLGEYVALALAGCLRLEDGIALVVRMAEIAESTCEEGRMLAVLAGASVVHRHPEHFEGVELAAVNTDENCVVSGTAQAVAACAAGLRRMGVVSHELPVRYPFHSSLIEPMREPFVRLLEGIEWRHPTVRVVSAHTARAVEWPPVMHPWRVIRCRVNFRMTVEGLERNGQPVYRDLGVSGTLANAVGYLLSAEDSHRVRAEMTPFDDNGSTRARPATATPGHGAVPWVGV